MAKITLDTIQSGYKSVAKWVSNFDLIQSVLNDKVLFRDNPDGEPNTMQQELDMNSQRIVNLPAPAAGTDAARYQDVLNGVTVTDTIMPTPSGSDVDRVVSTDGADFVFKDGDDMAFDQDQTGSTRRTIAAKLKESVSVEDFGAVGDNSTDDLTAFNNAISTGLPIVLKAGTTYRVSTIPDFVDSNIISNGAILDVDAGDHARTTGISFDSIVGNLTITTDQLVNETGGTVSLGTVTGSAKAWSVTVNASDTGGLSVGDYIVITTSDELRGCWEVTGVNTNTDFTFLHTGDWAVFPVSSISSIGWREIPTKVEFTSAASDFVGITVNNGSLTLGDIVLVGQYDYAANTSTNYTVGLLANNATVTFASSSLTAGQVGVSGWVTGSKLEASDVVETVNTSVSVGACSTGVDILPGSTVDVAVVSPTGCSIGIRTTNANVDTNVQAVGCALISCYSINSVTTLLSTDVFNGDSAQGINAVNSLVRANASAINDGATGMTCQSSIVSMESATITDATIGVQVTDGSIVHLNGGSISGATTQYDVDEGFVVDTSGEMRGSKFRTVNITEGISTPSTIAGEAQLFVDATSGDLNVVFGDGTVKTIVDDESSTFETFTTTTPTWTSTTRYGIFNTGGATTVTLPAPSSLPIGTELYLKTYAAVTVSSASANVVPGYQSTPLTTILTGGIGEWAQLVNDGTNWSLFATGDSI